jgi:hypothetical protein
VWHIKKLTKQHDHYTGAHNATDVKLRERAIDMLTAEVSTRAVAMVDINVVLENLAVRLNHVLPRQPRTSTSNFFTCGIVRDQPPRQLMKLMIISVIKPFLLGKNSF